jgi:hypothetical protein
LGVYGDGVLGDIVDVQVLHRRDLDFCWVHLGGVLLRALSNCSKNGGMEMVVEGKRREM